MTLVAAVEQASRRVLLLDADADADPGPWSESESAVRWSWSADHDPGCAGLGLPRSWNSPSEAKGRTRNGRQYLLTTASGGLAAVVERSTGRVCWARNTGNNNLHSIELLPDGAVAVAASTQSFVRLYSADPAGGPVPAELPLRGAHGLHWDADRRLLWALGSRQLLALRTGSDPDGAPTLRQVSAFPLPTRGGHDLAPVRADRDRLWVTTRQAVHQFSLRRGRFTHYRAQRLLSRPEVKSIGDDPETGRVLSLVPEPGHAVSWCSTGAELYERDGRAAGRLTLPGSGLYKVRWWVPRYH